MKKEGKKKQREREKLTLATAIYKKLNWCFCLWLVEYSASIIILIILKFIVRKFNKMFKCALQD